MKIIIDYEKCIGCGLCFMLCKKYFTLDDDGYCQLKKEKIQKEDLDSIKKIISACPTKVIKVKEEKYL